MKFALVGGDVRSAKLAGMLLGDGESVSSFALEKAELPPGIQKCGCLQSCVYGADCVILPAPAEKAGYLNAPLSDMLLPMAELLGSLWPGQLVCGGRFSELSRAQALRGKLRLEDVLERSDYCAMNAALTAEGALGLLCRESGKALFESSLLICGWGRIGKMLALRLASLGASVSVAARNVSDRAMVSALGFRALDYRSLEGELAAFDVIVNTVPARVISDAMLCLVPEDTLLVELASPPGGFDRMLAENFSLRVLHAPGLPAKSAPLSAAALMKRTVFALLEEGEE